MAKVWLSTMETDTAPEGVIVPPVPALAVMLSTEHIQLY